MVWKPIKKTNLRYEISNTGMVAFGGRIRKLTTNSKHGYAQCSFNNGGKISMMNVHREVAEAFLPNPHKMREVNHIDGNKLNNHVDNLEWTSRSKNIKHAYSTGLRKCSNNFSKLTEEQVLQIRREAEGPKTPARILAEKYEVNIRTIHRIKNRQIWRMV